MSDNYYYHNNSLAHLLQQVRHVSHQVAYELGSLYDTSYTDRSPLVDPLDSPASVVPVTVMFVDLRGFTALVEECAPNQVVRQLNEYFSTMTRIIVEHNGILDKYMGDEIMAYFESPNPLQHVKSAIHSVQAGIEMIYALEELNRGWQLRGWPTLKCGIGINSGPVLKGKIGSTFKMETTIIGDTVNVASRIQHLNKDYDARLLISANTYKWVQGEFDVRSLGDISIRGKKQPVGVYAIELPQETLPKAAETSSETTQIAL